MVSDQGQHWLLTGVSINKWAKMAQDCSPEFKVDIVQIVCVVEILSEFAWTLTNITSGNTCHAKFHASEASDSE